ncbi:peptidoglycan-binding protein [Roseibium litorale]|uniref:M15 family metallopeptidase n=1 Tax=Roseibium litorale TaxID=2803841 RepID=A0ABR9CJ97_9HYPH|nr:peptidoglycan-binding protein [Roseibium litorale]MBD8890915.1 M15 family metallopeptidase [Roseibium litorale]
MSLTKSSLKRLEGVHPDLVAVVMRAVEITDQPFQVSEGLRTLARQRQLVARGASKTLNSRHLTGHAVDLVAMLGGRISWEVPLYHTISDAMKQAARELNIPLEWGGDWRSFFDGPHFQLPRSSYPQNVNPARTAKVPEVSDRTEAQAAKTLAAGDKGEAVKDLQQTLQKLGYVLACDGDFGPVTRGIVRQFQNTAGLKADGIVGSKTRRALKAALSKKR